MGRPALSIEVKPKDQNELMSLLSGGVQQVRVVLRALVLLQLPKGASAPRIPVSATVKVASVRAPWCRPVQAFKRDPNISNRAIYELRLCDEFVLTRGVCEKSFCAGFRRPGQPDHVVGAHRSARVESRPSLSAHGTAAWRAL